MQRQLATSAAIVAFAAGSALAAGADGLGAAYQDPAANTLSIVPPVQAPSHPISVITETAETTIAPASIETSDPYAKSGTSTVVTEGQPGAATVSYTVTYFNGIEISRQEGLTVVTKPAVDEIIAIGSLVIPPTTPAQQGTNRALGQQLAADLYGWTGEEWTCLDNLWTRESNWRHTAENKSSGAYGIPQALPGDKMANFGADWRTNPATQIKWGLNYIKKRAGYGSPCRAWAHSQERGWY